MRCSPEELIRYKNVLNDNKQYIESVTIQNAITHFEKFSTAFRFMYNTLCEKKVIATDPYGNEHKNIKLELPERTPPEHNEEDFTISIRLSYFRALLDHILTKDILELTSLSPNKIQKIIEVVTFLDWDRIFDQQPIEVNTEALNKVIFDFKKESDQKFVVETLRISTKDLFMHSNNFMKEFSSIKTYIEERYKLWVRSEVIEGLELPETLEGSQIKSAHDTISEKIRALRKPLYIELVGEVLKEDFSGSGDLIKKEIFKGLESGGAVIKKERDKVSKVSTKDLITNSIIELSKIASQLDPVTIKQFDNSAQYREEKYNIIQKLLDYFKYSLSSNKRSTIYTIKLSSEPDQPPKSKELDFEKFITSVETLGKRLENCKNKDNEKLAKILLQDEKEIQAFAHKLLSKCRHTYKTLVALDAFFKENLGKAKGIQIELKTILSAIDKSQSHYFEFTKQMSMKKEEDTTYKPDTSPKA